jgi:hypothetical protein
VDCRPHQVMIGCECERHIHIGLVLGGCIPGGKYNQRKGSDEKHDFQGGKARVMRRASSLNLAARSRVGSGQPCSETAPTRPIPQCTRGDSEINFI